MTVFKAHKISALCWCFVSRNLVNTFPWVVGIVQHHGFPVLLNPGVVSHLAPKK